MNPRTLGRFVKRNRAHGNATKDRLLQLFSDAPPLLRHKPVGEPFDPETSEVFGHIRERLPEAGSDEIERIYQQCLYHRVLVFDRHTRLYRVANGKMACLPRFV